MQSKNYKGSDLNPLKKASIQALVQELRIREGVRCIKEKDTYTFIINKKDVEI